MKTGFSLMEMLIVVAIIGLLAALMMPNLLGSQDKAREAGVKAVLHALQSALETYNVDNLAYPAGTGLTAKALYEVLNAGGYLKSAPVNPFTGQAYDDADEAGKILYSFDGASGQYLLSGYKRDGATKILELSNS
jgi:type II secretion system protein G